MTVFCCLETKPRLQKIVNVCKYRLKCSNCNGTTPWQTSKKRANAAFLRKYPNHIHDIDYLKGTT